MTAEEYLKKDEYYEGFALDYPELDKNIQGKLKEFAKYHVAKFAKINNLNINNYEKEIK